MFSISEAKEDDIPAIIHIAEETWWPTYSNILSREQIRYMLDAIYDPAVLRSQMGMTETYLVLSDDGKVKGFVSYAMRSDDANVYKIVKLYVLPNNQKKGYGAALVEEVKQRVLKMNVRTLDLNVNRFNPSIRFYERIGFKILREEDVPVGPYWMNDYVMRLKF